MTAAWGHCENKAAGSQKCGDPTPLSRPFMLGWRLLAQAGAQVLGRGAGYLGAAQSSGNRWVWARNRVWVCGSCRTAALSSGMIWHGGVCSRWRRKELCPAEVWKSKERYSKEVPYKRLKE